MRGTTTKYIIDERDLKEFVEDKFIEDVSDFTLLSECVKRNLCMVQYDPVSINELQGLSKMKLHDFLADVVGLQHTCDNDTLLNELKEMI